MNVKELISVRRTWGPLLLMLCCPCVALLIWYTNVHLEGSLLALLHLFQEQGVVGGFFAIWAPVFWGSPVAWKAIAIFSLFQLLFMRYLPGKTFLGPLTPKGNIPEYKANGPLAFLLTLLIFVYSTFVWDLFPATLIYDHLGEILGALNVLSLAFCAFLYVKGRFFPSSSDAGVTGNAVFDYYWGTELYPRLGKYDLKQFTNCRFGMMSWGLILLSYCAKQDQLYGLSNALVLSVSLQLLYIAKFFYWETGYLRSLDIMHDRAGFYICWGCLVWVPCVYTAASMYLVRHPYSFSLWQFWLLFAAGAFCILVNYLADRQRQKVRQTQGNCLVWGKKAEVLVARYTTTTGERKESVLLVAGWWGLARHFHYVPEILGAFLWSMPALFTHVLPYFYVIFLTCLLVDRAMRDEKRCAQKYGEDWKTYCGKVPYRILPRIF